MSLFKLMIVIVLLLEVYLISYELVKAIFISVHLLLIFRWYRTTHRMTILRRLQFTESWLIESKTQRRDKSEKDNSSMSLVLNKNNSERKIWTLHCSEFHCFVEFHYCHPRHPSSVITKVVSNMKNEQPRYSIECWNQHVYEYILTNDPAQQLEGWHRHFSRLTCVSHPDIYKFISSR